jgi:DNA-binding transcriptional MerR regulator
VAAEAQMTIDELARRSGMTVRNLRAHQSRGLLPPPEVRGRTGFYGPDHVARVELIKELQADGFNLDQIRKLIDGAGRQSAQLLQLSRALRAPFVEEEKPEVLDLGELSEKWQSSDLDLLAKAVKLGVLTPLGEGRYEVVSPSLMAAAQELLALGIPADLTMAVAARLRRHADSVARIFAELFIEQIWEPFEADGRPEAGWPAVAEALDRLRPLAAESLLALFQIAMSEKVETELSRVIAGDDPRSRSQRRRRR